MPWLSVKTATYRLLTRFVRWRTSWLTDASDFGPTLLMHWVDNKTEVVGSKCSVKVLVINILFSTLCFLIPQLFHSLSLSSCNKPQPASLLNFSYSYRIVFRFLIFCFNWFWDHFALCRNELHRNAISCWYASSGISVACCLSLISVVYV